RHGVFAKDGQGDDALDEFKPSIVSEASQWSATSWMSFFPPSPRSQAPFDPEAVAELELAPKGWARTIRPIDHRTKDV
ncbi:unnamed protein product, partial [Symbiodinium sp. CCMP2456]